MNEANWFGLLAMIITIVVSIGMMKGCDNDHEIQMKCIEKTGDKFCGQLKAKTNEQK